MVAVVSVRLRVVDDEVDEDDEDDEVVVELPLPLVQIVCQNVEHAYDDMFTLEKLE